MDLATVVRMYNMPLHAVPQGVVRRIKLNMWQHEPKEFFVHEDTRAEQVKVILKLHVPELHAECEFFDSNGSAIHEDLLVKDLRGEIKVERHVRQQRDPTDMIRKSTRGHIFGTHILGKPELVPGPLPGADAKGFRTDETKVPGGPVPGRLGADGFVALPRRAPVAPGRAPPDEFGIDRNPLPEQLVLCPRGFRAERPGRLPPAAASVAARKPPDYEERLRNLEVESGADRKTCARCFNFHSYDFDRALRDLRRY
jgi:hypothetical protein